MESPITHEHTFLVSDFDDQDLSKADFCDMKPLVAEKISRISLKKHNRSLKPEQIGVGRVDTVDDRIVVMYYLYH